MAREIGADEQQVPDFILQAVAGSAVVRCICHGLELHSYFLDFLVQFGDHRFRAGPVETDARRAVLELHRALPFGHAARDAGEHGRVAIAGSGAFGMLERFPVARLRIGIGDIGVAENVRMPAPHLVGDRFDDPVEIECATLLGHARMEHDLQQQVAEFVAQVGHVIAIDGIGDFVRLLDGVGRDGRERLCDVPWAARSRIAQPRHDGEQRIDAIARRRVAHNQSRHGNDGSPSAMNSPLSSVSRRL